MNRVPEIQEGTNMRSLVIVLIPILGLAPSAQRETILQRLIPFPQFQEALRGEWPVVTVNVIVKAFVN